MNDDRERLRALSEQLDLLVTEALNPSSADLDILDINSLLRVINREDASVAGAVEKVLPAVAEAVTLIIGVFRSGGRLFYLGAGTSGRLGVLDASECPPTFGTEPEMVKGVIAGGEAALVRSSEGMEDDGERGWLDLEAAGAGSGDVVVGITASTRTPYVVAGLAEARRRGLATVYLTCNPEGAPGVNADVTINPVVGPEVVAGSTRMKAGTVTKLVLNMLTTGAFVSMGKTYGNLMVDLRPVSDKLRARARRIVMIACGVGFDEADDALRKTGEDTKAAILLIRGPMDREAAVEAASAAEAKLRDLLDGRPPAHQEGIERTENQP